MKLSRIIVNIVTVDLIIFKKENTLYVWSFGSKNEPKYIFVFSICYSISVQVINLNVSTYNY